MKNVILAAAAFLGLAASMASACPTITEGVHSYSFTGTQLLQPVGIDVTAGGDRDLTQCGHIYSNLGSDRPEYGGTYFTGQPDFSIFLQDMGRYKIDIRVVSECDSALLINTGAVNWYFDDDDLGNLDPRIWLTRPSGGRMDIWVGALDGPCNAQLQLETFHR